MLKFMSNYDLKMYDSYALVCNAETFRLMLLVASGLVLEQISGSFDAGVKGYTLN